MGQWSRVHTLIGALISWARLRDRGIAPHGSGSSKRFTLAIAPDTLHVYMGEVMIREVHGFAGKEDEVFVGVMACSPKGGGVEAIFRDLAITEGVREH